MPSHPAPSEPAGGVLARAAHLLDEAAAEHGGALWRLAAEGRQLDANLVRLAAGTSVPEHVEPDLDVLVCVVAGGGALRTDAGEQELRPGFVAWLPHGTRRAVRAGAADLAYVTVHRRRPGLTIGTRDDAARTAPPTPRAPRDTVVTEGGEPACLLHRVCPECGRLAQESDARYCARCGEPLPAD
ncbi:hypothetical protein [Streptomyces sp. TS71-3]|uniref:hypothetical protein n=1 Tax=Streptomyces sp. TS71-3 TaxID=2733862 RepID=UPI001B14ECFC|nr:hypothetical protein [Streptomyces sp. TS71-3]GHJ39187.1 hypothetical protein Sm713_47960 [Streptomyces sp. TS71-3]